MRAGCSPRSLQAMKEARGSRGRWILGWRPSSTRSWFAAF
jgi:hypothetical protein